MPKHIAVIVGSLRNDSLNLKFANALCKLSAAGFSFEFVGIGDLPLFNQDDEASPAPETAAFREAIKASDAVIFVTPEYNRSIPGVLKNAIDQGSRPYGHSVWSGRPAAIVGVSTGAVGTAVAQQHLRTILAHLNMPTMGQPEAFIHANQGTFDEAGNLSEGTGQFMQKWMDTFVAFVGSS